TGLQKTHLPIEEKALNGIRSKLIVISYSQRADGLACWLQRNQPPVRSQIGQRTGGQQRRRSQWMHFHVEGVQRQVQSQAFSFQQGFFAGPASIESSEPIFRGKISQGEQFVRREMMVGHIGINISNALDVNSQLI